METAIESAKSAENEAVAKAMEVVAKTKPAAKPKGEAKPAAKPKGEAKPAAKPKGEAKPAAKPKGAPTKSKGEARSPMTLKGMKSVFLSGEVHARLKSAAATRGVTIGQAVEALLQHGLNAVDAGKLNINKVSVA